VLVIDDERIRVFGAAAAEVRIVQGKAIVAMK
jgi:hypothetical protein